MSKMCFYQNNLPVVYYALLLFFFYFFSPFDLHFETFADESRVRA